ncbi:MAG: hypothetical protein ACLSBH_23335 [Coprobacillus cateniformis]
MKFIDWEKVDAYEETLKKVEQDLGVEYVSDNRESLVVLLCQLWNRETENLF